MAERAIRTTGQSDDFARLHRVFVEHFGFAVLFAWASAAVSATQAPWLRNIRGLIDPSGRTESTASFLFCMPAILLLGWVSVALGGDLLRRSTMLRSHSVEFGVAGASAFAVFCMAIYRAVLAASLGL